MQLFIGDKHCSDWSLSAWLVLKKAGSNFSEKVIRLHGPEASNEIQGVSPSGLIPCLHAEDLVIWDSLAIAEWAAERYSTLWPSSVKERTLARSVCAEIHSGFQGLRTNCPMDLGSRMMTRLTSASCEDLMRLCVIWSELRSTFAGEGPYLFGSWTIADAFCTPLATLLRTYGLKLGSFGSSDVAEEYAEFLLADYHFRLWEQDARQSKMAVGEGGIARCTPGVPTTWSFHQLPL